MRTLKRIVSTSLAFTMLFLVCGQALALASTSEKTAHAIYDYDHDLAMERGYLVKGDDLPQGVILEEGEEFVPASVPDPMHRIAMMQRSAEDYNWVYNGYTRGNSRVDAWFTGVVLYVTASLYGLAAPSWSIALGAVGVSALDLLEELAELLEDPDDSIRLTGYYNKFMWYTYDDPIYPYIYKYQVDYYTDQARTADDYIGTTTYEEYALLPR